MSIAVASSGHRRNGCTGQSSHCAENQRLDFVRLEQRETRAVDNNRAVYGVFGSASAFDRQRSSVKYSTSGRKESSCEEQLYCVHRTTTSSTHGMQEVHGGGSSHQTSMD